MAPSKSHAAPRSYLRNGSADLPVLGKNGGPMRWVPMAWPALKFIGGGWLPASLVYSITGLGALCLWMAFSGCFVAFARPFSFEEDRNWRPQCMAGFYFHPYLPTRKNGSYETRTCHGEWGLLNWTGGLVMRGHMMAWLRVVVGWMIAEPDEPQVWWFHHQVLEKEHPSLNNAALQHVPACC